MIKINLLPDSIFEPARKKALLAGSVVVLAAMAVGMFFWSSTTTAEKLARTDECNTQKLAAEAVDRIEAQVTTVEQSFAELKTKVQNVRDIYCHNLVYVKLYKTLADWTPSSYRYDSMVAHNATANMNVYTRKLDDVAYYLQSMQKCPAIAPAGISLGGYAATTANGAGGGAAPSTGGSSMGALSPMMPMSPSGGGVTSPMMPMSPGSTAPSTSGARASSQTGSGQHGYVFPVTVTLKSSVPPAPAGFGPVGGGRAAGGAPSLGGAGGMGLMGSPTSSGTGNFGAPGTTMMPRSPGSASNSAGPSIPGGGPMAMPGKK